MFDLDDLVEALRAAGREREPQAVAEVLEQALRPLGHHRQPSAARSEGRPGIQILHTSPQFSILEVVWAPGRSVTSTVAVPRGRSSATAAIVNRCTRSFQGGVGTAEDRRPPGPGTSKTEDALVRERGLFVAVARSARCSSPRAR
jgi:hypothetical protein